jgi:hypothetical protein
MSDLSTTSNPSLNGDYLLVQWLHFSDFYVWRAWPITTASNPGSKVSSVHRGSLYRFLSQNFEERKEWQVLWNFLVFVWLQIMCCSSQFLFPGMSDCRWFWIQILGHLIADNFGFQVALRCLIADNVGIWLNSTLSVWLQIMFVFDEILFGCLIADNVWIWFNSLGHVWLQISFVFDSVLLGVCLIADHFCIWFTSFQSLIADYLSSQFSLLGGKVWGGGGVQGPRLRERSGRCLTLSLWHKDTNNWWRAKVGAFFSFLQFLFYPESLVCAGRGEDAREVDDGKVGTDEPKVGGRILLGW